MPAPRLAHSGAAPRQRADLARLAFSLGPGPSEQRSRGLLALTYSQRAPVASLFSAGQGGVRRRSGCQLRESSEPEPESSGWEFGSSERGAAVSACSAEQSGGQLRCGRQLPENSERRLPHSRLAMLRQRMICIS